MSEMINIASQYSRNSGSYSKWRLALASTAVSSQIKKSSDRQILATVVSTAILSSGLSKINKSIAFSAGMLNATITNGFDQVNTNLGKISNDLGYMSTIFSLGLSNISDSINKMSKEVCTRLDEIHDTLKNPILTQARELYLRAEDNYKRGFFEESLADVDESIKLNRTDYISWFLKGHIYLFGAGEFCNIIDPAKAEEAFLNAAKYISPDIADSDDARKLASEIYYYLAYSRYILSNETASNDSEKEKEYLDKAITAAKKSYTLSDLNHESLYLACKCYTLSDKQTEAIENLRELFELNAIYCIKILSDADFTNNADKINILIKELTNNIRPEAFSSHRQVQEIAETHEFLGGPYSDSIEQKVKTCLSINEINENTAYYDMWIICRIAPEVKKGINEKEYPCDRLVFKKKRPDNCYNIKYDEKTGELFFPTTNDFSSNSIDWDPTFFENPYNGSLIIHPKGEYGLFDYNYKCFERKKLEDIFSYASLYHLVGLTYNYNSLKAQGKLYLVSTDIRLDDSRLHFFEETKYWHEHFSLYSGETNNPVGYIFGSFKLENKLSPGKSYGFNETHINNKWNLFLTNESNKSDLIQLTGEDDGYLKILGYLDKNTLLIITSEAYYVYQAGISKKEVQIINQPSLENKEESIPSYSSFQELDPRKRIKFEKELESAFSTNLLDVSSDYSDILHKIYWGKTEYDFSDYFNSFDEAIEFMHFVPMLIDEKKKEYPDARSHQFDEVKNLVPNVLEQIKGYSDEAHTLYNYLLEGEFRAQKHYLATNDKINKCLSKARDALRGFKQKVYDARWPTKEESEQISQRRKLEKKQSYIRDQLGTQAAETYKEAYKKNDISTMSRLTFIANKDKIIKIIFATLFCASIFIYMTILLNNDYYNMKITCIASAIAGFIICFTGGACFIDEFFDDRVNILVGCFVMAIFFLGAGWVLYHLGPLTRLLAGLVMIACPIAYIALVFCIITDSLD